MVKPFTPENVLGDPRDRAAYNSMVRQFREVAQALRLVEERLAEFEARISALEP